MKKEKIKLRKGDKVCYRINSGETFTIIVDGYDGASIKEFEKEIGVKIIKIERPEYKTIYEVKEILDKKEKEYLEAVVRPFKSKVKFIVKKIHSCYHGTEFLEISLGDDSASLPDFEEGTMYKGMKQFKHYTLKELGLFTGE